MWLYYNILFMLGTCAREDSENTLQLNEDTSTTHIKYELKSHVFIYELFE